MTNKDESPERATPRVSEVLASGDLFKGCAPIVIGLVAIFLAFTMVRGLAVVVGLTALVWGLVRIIRPALDSRSGLVAIGLGSTAAVLAVLMIWAFKAEWVAARDIALPLIPLVGIAVLVFLAFSRARDRVAAMPDGERRQRAAEADGRRRLRDAQQLLRSAEYQYAQGVLSAEQARARAALVGRQPLGGYGTVQAWEHRIVTDRGAYPMSGDVRATVDSAGHLAVTSRSTLTRIAAGGLLLGPVGLVVGAAARKSTTIDQRELYLLVESAAFATVVACRPDDGAIVHQLASAINNAAKRVDAAAAAHASAVEAAEAKVVWARGNTKPVEDARRRLEVEQAAMHTLRLERASLPALEQQGAVQRPSQ